MHLGKERIIGNFQLKKMEVEELYYRDLLKVFVIIKKYNTCIVFYKIDSSCNSPVLISVSLKPFNK